MQFLTHTAEITVYPLREVWTMPGDLAENLLAFINLPGIYDAYEGNPYSAWLNGRTDEEKSQIGRVTSAY